MKVNTIMLSFILLLVINLPLFGNREKFYIAEEMFLSGEFIKAKGLYQQIDTNALSSNEIELLKYRLSLLSPIGESMIILSNSTLPESVRLMNFLNAYIYGSNSNIEDAISTQKEIVIYQLLQNTDITKLTNQNVLLALKLYYSLSNLKAPKQIDSFISNGNEFIKLKNMFIESIVYRNLGDNSKSQELISKIANEYPGSFFAYIIKNNSTLQLNQGAKSSDTSSGYYLTFEVSKVNDKMLDELRSEANFSGYSLDISNDKVYIGPFEDKNKAMEFGKNISAKYRIEMSLVKVSKK